nr:hypothetical protein [Nitrosomonas nitrosa]
MSSRFCQKWFRQYQHPSEEELLLLLDGELSERTASRIHAHLEACWACRVRREKVEQSISAFMSYCEARNADAGDFSPPAQASFAARLHQLVVKSDAQSVFFRFQEAILRRFSAPHFATALGVSLISLSLLAALWLWPGVESPVSASEILRRAATAEANKLQHTTGKVVYRKFHVRRSSRSDGTTRIAYWKTWRDHVNDRFGQEMVESADNDSSKETASAPRKGRINRQPAGSMLLGEIARVFQVNRMDLRQPLSIADFEAWRSSLQSRTDTVTRTRLADGAEALIVTTRENEEHGDFAIFSAALTLRVSDWEPIMERLEVKAKGEIYVYELSETMVEALALDAVGPAVFGAVSAGVEPANLRSAAVEPSPLPSPAFVPSNAELLAAEVEVYYILHQVKACTDEPFELSRNAAGSLELRGLAETAQQKEKLLAALSAVPFLTPKIQTFEEAARADLSHPNALTGTSRSVESSSAGNTETIVRSSRLAIQLRLEEYFRQQQAEATSGARLVSPQRQVIELTNKAISLSESAYAEAWALRRLAEWYQPGRLTELRPSSRLLVEQMVKDHLTELWRRNRSLHSLLAPALPTLVGEPSSATDGDGLAGGPSEQNWPAQAMRVFTLVERLDQLTHGLFAGAKLPAGTPQQAARELRDALSELEHSLQALERKF